ncbi:lipopolysaccharide assembly protein LapA domain-containing protein [Aquibacillus koreensis]|uniref:Lipopolysaccharide assembly protein LapA domain-containing protein n=1 Tax=Aquibacillus koreensis TaxID=279446 RepID=A0A9X3WIH4_9BACI|nr:lipopolysaccharide assembly protein LapA domain-containing protein [Aquibacillus koreensis]MCT2537994.1 lipopolysaccharide assembly protein LapA domain-containing protein [Aquibacillus koreensis]MDC3419115.1 lipopolysaccharide assembly protein LapA domain-containing protein [Aquibacillus koreensis]
MKGQTYIILALVFAVIVAIFAVINVEPVEVNYLFGTGNSPLILVILVSVLMGGIITASVGIVRLFKLQREIRLLKQENLKLQENSGNDVDESKSNEEKTLSPSQIGQSSGE